ncbi:MAG: DegV family protein [Chloroflexi bacterium]|nr:DegV family protein [Chloroflexota bacterium]MCC6896936.1 DegV family protein [Anaerolineae bacterium]
MTSKKIRFIADSTCDIPQDVLKKWDITIIPAFVNYGGNSYADDGVELDRVAYYDQLPTMPAQPTTAAPPPGLTEAIISRVAAEADHVVMLTVPATLSGIYNTFRLGASNLPPETYTLIDSGTTTMGMGFQVMVGAEVAAATGSVAEVVSAIERARKHIRLYAAPESMTYLRRSGRVGWAAAGAATLLQIKPIVAVSDGVVESTARVRTFGKAVEKMVELALEQAPIDRLALLHTNNLHGAQDMRQQLGNAIPAETYTINITPVLGTHVGPKALGVVTLNNGWRQ